MAFQKGQSGNPGGRSKDEKPWTEALRMALNSIDKNDKGEKLKKIRLVAEACVNAGLAGDISAIKEIGDRMDGKAPQPQVHQGDPDKPLKHIHELAFRSDV